MWVFALLAFRLNQACDVFFFRVKKIGILGGLGV